jgi:hypothetical protein
MPPRSAGQANAAPSSWTPGWRGDAHASIPKQNAPKRSGRWLVTALWAALAAALAAAAINFGLV